MLPGKFVCVCDCSVPIDSWSDEPFALVLRLRCGPCRHFTPTLAQVYKECQKQNKPLEIVFISRDRSEADFDKYFKSEMPWLALPYEERALQEVRLRARSLSLALLYFGRDLVGLIRR